MTKTASYDAIVASGPDGSRNDFTVYRVFSAAEFDGFGVPRSAVQGGTMWVSGDSSDSRAVYFLSAAGVGVRVASTSTTGNALTLDALHDEAFRLTTVLSAGGA